MFSLSLWCVSLRFENHKCYYAGLWTLSLDGWWQQGVLVPTNMAQPVEGGGGCQNRTARALIYNAQFFINCFKASTRNKEGRTRSAVAINMADRGHIFKCTGHDQSRRMALL